MVKPTNSSIAVIEFQCLTRDEKSIKLWQLNVLGSIIDQESGYLRFDSGVPTGSVDGRAVEMDMSHIDRRHQK